MRWVRGLVVGVLLLGGLVGLTYPFASAWWGSRGDALLVGEVSDEWSSCADCVGLVEEARLLNDSGDIFELSSDEYFKLFGGREPFGVVRVPSVDIGLPVFLGTGLDVLDKGVGHVFGSSLPVGGLSSHSVLTAHTGLGSRIFFDRLVDVVEGDLVFVEVLGEVFVYEVFKIEVVQAEDFGKSVGVVVDKDLLSLATCTPYAVNTHRLVITGERVDWVAEDGVGLGSSVVSWWSAWVWFVPFILGVIVIIWLVVSLVRRG